MVEFDTNREIGTEKEGRSRGLIKFLRDVLEGMKHKAEGRESELGFGTVKWRRGPGFVHVEYGFEERTASPHATFKFQPTANVRSGGTTRQGSDIEELGGKAEEIGSFIEAMADLPLEFAELSAASQGHQNLTNYEFEYETAIDKGKVDSATFDEVAKEAGLL